MPRWYATNAFKAAGATRQARARAILEPFREQYGDKLVVSFDWELIELVLQERAVKRRDPETGRIVGGTAAADRNLISGNNAQGLTITGTTATGNQVLGSLIGTQANGTTGLANGGDGVHIDTSAANNTIGGTEAADGNVIGSLFVGVGIYNGSPSNRVLNNKIGTDPTGTARRPLEAGVVVVARMAERDEVGVPRRLHADTVALAQPVYDGPR